MNTPARCPQPRIAAVLVRLTALAALSTPLLSCDRATNPFYVPAEISYPDSLIAFVGIAVDTTIPELAKNVEVDSYTVAPALPAGLEMNPLDGAIAGIPEGPAGLDTYTFNAHNQWGVSDDATLTIMVCPPAPQGLTATGDSARSAVALSWQPVDSVDQYGIYRSAERDAQYARIGQASQASFGDSTQLAAGEQYFYYVCAEHAETWPSPASDTVSATVPLVVVITSPSTDTIVTDTVIIVQYTVNGTPQSRTVSLVDGANEVVIDSTSPSGTIGSDTVSVTMDTTAPGAPVVQGASPTNDPTPTWSWSSDSAGCGVFRYALDSNDLAEASPETTVTSFTPESDLTQGTHTLYVWERDVAGNWSQPGSKAIEIDATVPGTPQVTGVSPTNNAQPTWTWSSAGGDGIFRLRLDNDDLSSADETTDTSFAPATALTEGAHTLYVQERNSAGTWSASGVFVITIDLTPPAAPAVTGPAQTAERRPAWSWSSGGDGGNGTFRYRLDNADLSVGAATTADTSFAPGSDLSEGSHTLYVQERDAAGNWSISGSFVVTIDLTPPNPPVVTGPAQTAELRPTWTWSSGGGGNGTFRYRLNNASLTAGATTTNETSFAPDDNLGQGSHTLFVQERDSAGNWSASGSHSIDVDTTALIVSVDAPTLTRDSTVVDSAAVNISGTVQNAVNVKSVSATLNGVPVAVRLSGKQWHIELSSLLGTQWNEVVVTAMDDAGRSGKHSLWLYGRFGLETPRAPTCRGLCFSYDVEWQYDDGYDGYILWRKLPSRSDFTKLAEGLQDTFYNDGETLGARTMEYRLQAYYDRQTGSFRVQDTSGLSSVVWCTTMVCFQTTTSASLEDVAPMGSSGFAVAASANESAMLLRFDSEGNEVGATNYSEGSADNFGLSVAVAPDGHLFLAGMSWASSPAAYAFALKATSDGTTIWAKRQYAGAAAHDIVALNDGGYAITGEADSGSAMWIARGGADGDTLWTTHHSLSDFSQRGRAILQRTDGSFTVAGGFAGMSFIEIGINGAIGWRTRIVDSECWSASQCNSITQLPDGAIIGVGKTCGNDNEADGADGWVGRIDEGGDTVWTMTLGGIGTKEEFHGVAPAPRDGVLVVGEKNGQSWLVKVSADGDTLWSKTGTFGNKAIHTTPDGGFILAGGNHLTKTDRLGSYLGL